MLSGYALEQRLEAEPGQADPERATEHGNDDPFGHELADQTSASGAERRSHGELAPAGLGAGQQQVGEVRAGDEQHEADRALKHPERRLTVPTMSSCRLSMRSRWPVGFGVCGAFAITLPASEQAIEIGARLRRGRPLA